MSTEPSSNACQLALCRVHRAAPVSRAAFKSWEIFCASCYPVGIVGHWTKAGAEEAWNRAHKDTHRYRVTVSLDFEIELNAGATPYEISAACRNDAQDLAYDAAKWTRIDAAGTEPHKSEE